MITDVLRFSTNANVSLFGLHEIVSYKTRLSLRQYCTVNVRYVEVALWVLCAFTRTCNKGYENSFT